MSISNKIRKLLVISLVKLDFERGVEKRAFQVLADRGRGERGSWHHHGKRDLGKKKNLRQTQV